MQLFNSIIRKPFIVGLIVTFFLACGLATSRNHVTLSGITLLIINEGITPITVRGLAGKLAWVFPGTQECVTLRNINTTQRLTARVGRSNLYIISVEFIPLSSSTRSWIWSINERLPFLSAGRIYWAASPCKK